MKEFYARTNQKKYYIVTFTAIILMILGLFINNPLIFEFNVGGVLHIVLVVFLSISLLLYPKYENYIFRLMIISSSSIYLYTIFFLYPDTRSSFILICLIPAISIVFFDSKLFYFTITLNSLFLTFTVIYLFITNTLSFISDDLIGNIINFVASQVIIYFIFYLTNSRLKKLQLYYEQLQNSERLQTSAQLAAAVAHEIRNPLTVVKGFLQFYSETSDSTFKKEAKDHFNVMIDELNVAEEVITQFLTISKPDKNPKTEIVNVKDVLNSVTDLLKSYGLLKDNRIDINITEDYFILANNIEIKQLMVNIIKNAIEASNTGESISIKVKRKKKDIVIHVIDYGLGMSEEEVKSLGTPFYSLKSNGTGLGLMICYHIIKKYKGTIKFISEKGKGTTVTITFPAIEK